MYELLYSEDHISSPNGSILPVGFQMCKPLEKPIGILDKTDQFVQ